MGSHTTWTETIEFKYRIGTIMQTEYSNAGYVKLKCKRVIQVQNSYRNYLIPKYGPLVSFNKYIAANKKVKSLMK